MLLQVARTCWGLASIRSRICYQSQTPEVKTAQAPNLKEILQSFETLVKGSRLRMMFLVAGGRVPKHRRLGIIQASDFVNAGPDVDPE